VLVATHFRSVFVRNFFAILDTEQNVVNFPILLVEIMDVVCRNGQDAEFLSDGNGLIEQRFLAFDATVR